MNFLTIFNGMKHSILLALTLQASLIADQVTTTDGSVLVGQILGMQDGNLTIKTEFAGKRRHQLPDHRGLARAAGSREHDRARPEPELQLARRRGRRV